MKLEDWKDKFIFRLIEHGIEQDFAEQTCEAVNFSDIDLELDDPEDEADEELSCWEE